MPDLRNLKRSDWRSKCRRALAAHIEEQCRLTFDPAQIRLQPDANDGYRWSYVSEKAYLFTKPLSKLSVGAYMELCRELGKSYEAVVIEPSDTHSQTSPSFSLTIEHLTQERECLQDKLTQWQTIAKKEQETRQELEIRSDDMQLKLVALCERVDILESENNCLRNKVGQLRLKLGGSRRQNNKVVQALRKWRRAAEEDSDSDSTGQKDTNA